MQVISAKKTAFFLQQKAVYIIYFIAINAMNIAALPTSKMNTWNIFRSSFWHIIKHDDIYTMYPAEFFDQYQYSPSFPLLFAPFASLPYYIGYFFWNNLSMLLIPFLIFRFKNFSTQKKAIVCYIGLIEMLVCLQGTQSNVMIANLILLAFLSFENKQQWLAAFAIAAGTYVKIFPIIAASLFLLYPDKLKFVLKMIVALLVLGALPLMIFSTAELGLLYKKWFDIIVADQGDNSGRISLTGMMQVYLHLSNFSKLIIQIIGILIFCLMYIRTNLFKEYYYRIYFLCSVLLWVTLFNHVSEIFTYSIAICGVGFWFIHQKPGRNMNIFILFFVFIATVLSIDPTPRVIIKYIYEHSLKALPFTLIWLCIIYQMLSKKQDFFKLNSATEEN